MKSKEYRAFSEALEKVLSVPHTEIKQRELADKGKRKYVGKKRGPKPKASVSDRASGDKY